MLLTYFVGPGSGTSFAQLVVLSTPSQSPVSVLPSDNPLTNLVQVLLQYIEVLEAQLPRVDNLEQSTNDLQAKTNNMDSHLTANGAVAESLRQYLQQQNGPLSSSLDHLLQIHQSHPPSRCGV